MSQGFFKVRKLGDRLQIDAIQTESSYAVRLSSQYEDRSISQAKRPYPGGAVDDRGTPPRPWDIAVQRPDKFEDRTEHVPVPHTESIHTCSDCGGAGRVTCSQCHGWGQVNCTLCSGRGYRERTEFRQVQGPGGQMQTVRLKTWPKPPRSVAPAKAFSRNGVAASSTKR